MPEYENQIVKSNYQIHQDLSKKEKNSYREKIDTHQEEDFDFFGVSLD